jgi:Family of unknown function (DUF5898)
MPSSTQTFQSRGNHERVPQKFRVGRKKTCNHSKMRGVPAVVFSAWWRPVAAVWSAPHRWSSGTRCIDKERKNRLASVAAEIRMQAHQGVTSSEMRRWPQEPRDDSLKKHDMDEKPLREKASFALEDLAPYIEAVNFLRQAGITDIKPVNLDDMFPAFRWKYHPRKRQEPHQTTLLYPIGTGRTGQCWLAVTKEGCICVVKVFTKRGRDWYNLLEKAEIECEGWNTIYSNHLDGKVSELVLTLDNEIHLRMPYIRALSDTADGEIRERMRLLQEGGEGSLAQALRFFAAQGYRHPSIKWKHVGRESSDPESKIIFFDLGSVERPVNWGDGAREKWAQESLDHLWDAIYNGNL